jgi:hypothetical protein
MQVDKFKKIYKIENIYGNGGPYSKTSNVLQVLNNSF